MKSQLNETQSEINEIISQRYNNYKSPHLAKLKRLHRLIQTQFGDDALLFILKKCESTYNRPIFDLTKYTDATKDRQSSH